MLEGLRFAFWCSEGQVELQRALLTARFPPSLPGVPAWAGCSRSPGVQAGVLPNRSGDRLSRSHYCDGLEQLMCQWPLLGGCVFSGLMNRHTTTGSSELPGPGGGWFDSERRRCMSRAPWAEWGVVIVLWEAEEKGDGLG